MKQFFFRMALSTVLCAASLLWASHPAKADVAPPPAPNGVNIAPGSSTNVRMVSETVIINVASYSLYPTGLANVTATFQMRNLGGTEERMDVRFPLYASEHSADPYDDMTLFYPGLENFTASVDGNFAPVDYTDVINYPGVYADGDWTTLSKPTWAAFPVVFPPGKDVNITVNYIQSGAATYSKGTITNYVKYAYLLSTGAGWKDTIGSADIIVRMPVEVNGMTLMEAEPDSFKISGYDVRWHFENIDPGLDAQNDQVSVGIMQPEYYFKIQDAIQNLAAHPGNGDAWGQLGKAYKLAGMMGYGFRDDAVGDEMFQKSAAAYQKAVDLLPLDSEWHYGYADLLCNDAMWKGYNHTDPKVASELYGCFQELDKVLALDPNNQDAIALSQILAARKVKNPGGTEPAIVFLTPATRTPTLITSPTPTHTLLPIGTDIPIHTPAPTIDLRTNAPAGAATITYEPTSTPLTGPTNTVTPSPVPTYQSSPAPSTGQTNSSNVWLGGLGIVGIIIVVLGLFFWQRRNPRL